MAPKNTSTGVVLAAIFIAIAIYFASQSSNNSAAQTSTQSNRVENQDVTSDEHIASYVRSLISVFHNLYLSTQELANVQNEYPTSSEDIQQTTAMLRIDSDLSDALGVLQPYLDDRNDGIQAPTKLIYADILMIKNANSSITEALRTATPETLNPQEIKYTIAQYAAAQSNLQKDLFQNQLLRVITKGLIQIPVEDGEATGQIKYSLTSSQRQDLIAEIQGAFGSALDDYSKNTYLLAAKVLQLSLSFETYEEQKAYKL